MRPDKWEGVIPFGGDVDLGEDVYVSGGVDAEESREGEKCRKCGGRCRYPRYGGYVWRVCLECGWKEREAAVDEETEEVRTYMRTRTRAVRAAAMLADPYARGFFRRPV